MKVKHRNIPDNSFTCIKFDGKNHEEISKAIKDSLHLKDKPNVLVDVVSIDPFKLDFYLIENENPRHMAIGFIFVGNHILVDKNNTLLIETEEFFNKNYIKEEEKAST